MCDTLCMLGEAAVRGLIDCIYINTCRFLWQFSKDMRTIVLEFYEREASKNILFFL